MIAEMNDAIQRARGAASDTKDQIDEAVEETMERIDDGLLNVIETVTDRAENAHDRMIAEMNEAIERARGAASDTKDQIDEAVYSYQDWAEEQRSKLGEPEAVVMAKVIKETQQKAQTNLYKFFTVAAFAAAAVALTRKNKSENDYDDKRDTFVIEQEFE